MRRNSDAGATKKTGPRVGWIHRICRPLFGRRRLSEVERSLEEQILRGERQAADLIALHSSLAELGEEVARAAQMIAELAALQPRLLKLESGWRQHIAASAHATAVLREITDVQPQPRLLKLESALQQQIAAHRHLIEFLRSKDDEIDGGSWDNLKWALWDELNQLHGRVQEIAGALHIDDGQTDIITSLKQRLISEIASRLGSAQEQLGDPLQTMPEDRDHGESFGAHDHGALTP
jgi:hypothetical protein